MSLDGSPAKTDACCNFAVQLTRLGQRTLVLDLDPQLPNVGFHLGLEPQAYMAHLGAAAPQVVRALLGLRVVVGLAASGDLESETLHGELAASDCILVSLPALRTRGVATLGRLSSVLGRRSETTMSHVALRSPMFGAWLGTSPRAVGSSAATSDAVLDALVLVHNGEGAGDLAAAYREIAAPLGPTRVRVLAYGSDRTATEPAPWACVQKYGSARLGGGVLSSLYPEHPAARTYQGLVQSLLAAPATPGGERV